MISLYDKTLLFHCYSRPALKLGRRFLEEEFEGRLEFDYEDTLELTDRGTGWSLLSPSGRSRSRMYGRTTRSK